MEIAKLTGEIKGVMVGVKLLHGIEAYAYVSNSFPIVGIPSKKWVDTYKDKFWATLEFLDESEEKIITGFIPVSENLPTTDKLDSGILYRSDKFNIWLDDSSNKCTIEALDGGEILFGTPSAEEPLVLGNKLVSLMDKLLDAISTLSVTTAQGPSGTPINVAQFTALKGELNTLLSKKVKTE